MKKLLGVVIACSLLLSACLPRDIALARRCLSSTVLVHIKIAKGDKRGMGTCSGVYVAPNLILTANHCVDMEDGLELKGIWIRNVYDEAAKAEIVKVDAEKDLALLKTSLKGIPVSLARKVTVGEEVWVIGQPLGLKFVVTKGIISSLNVSTLSFPINHFITDAVVLPGNSGGPAFNSRGQLVGILTMSTSVFGVFGAAGLGIVVQIDEVRKFLKQK